MPVRGLMHDLSKFSPIEFLESAKYYTGTSSPIDVCKKDKGISMAWMNHKSKNKHHYEYFIDNFDNGGTALKMPYKFVAELVCDYLAAGQAYMKKEFSYKGEYEWWENKKSKPILMHEKTLRFIDCILYELTIKPEEWVLNKKHFKSIYDEIEKGNL